MAYIRQPLRGIPIRYKKIKGKLYAYQRIDAHRDKETGKVVVKDRHLGAVTPARPKPIMEQLTAADHNRVAKAWRDGEDMDLIIARIEAYTGDQPAPATVYNFMRAQGIKREHRTTARAAKRTGEVEARVEHVKRQKAEEKKRKARQAEIRNMFEAKEGKRKPLSEAHKRNISAAKRGIPYDEWEAFACEKKYCPKFNEACRESNREKYGRRCFICNKTEKANGQKLSVHHVDLNRAQGCESNWKLVPLCMACHAKAHNDELVSRLGYILKK